MEKYKPIFDFAVNMCKKTVEICKKADAWLDKDIPQNQSLPNIAFTSKILMSWAFLVIIRLHGVGALPSAVRKPAGKGEVYGMPSTLMFGGIQAFQFYVPLKPDNQDIAIDILDTQEVLQLGFIQALEEGKLPNQPHMTDSNGNSVPVVYFDDVPIVNIENITREKLRLTVTAFWVDTSEMATAVKNLRMRSENDCLGGEIDVTDKNF